MGENRYLELAMDFLNKRDNLQKAGVQGNVLRRILSYMGIDEDLYVYYEEVCNGKTVDCLIDIDGLRLPIYIVNYNKEKRDDIHYFNEMIKGYESLLKQFMLLNKMPLGIITNGYTLVFFELLADDITRIRNIWLPNILRGDSISDKGILSDRDFLGQYCFDNIKITFEKYLDLELLDNFVFENILNVSDVLLDWVNTKLDSTYPLEALKNSINKAFFDRIMIEKKEKMKETIIRVEKEASDEVSKEEILKLDISGLEKLNRILESPCICSILDEQIVEFTGWRNLFINVLEFVLSKNKAAYQEFIDKRGHKAKFNVIQTNASIYQQYISDSNYRKLSNGDLMYSSLDRVRICSLIIEALESLRIEHPFITIVYSDNTSLCIEGKNTANPVIPVIPNKLDNNDELNLSYMQTIKKVLEKENVDSDILSGIRNNRYTKYRVYGRSFDFEGYAQIVYEIVNSIARYDVDCYEKIKKLDLGSRFFILNPSREMNVQPYQKIRNIVNGDKYVCSASGDECIKLVYVLLSFSEREDKDLIFFK